ncbi:MAG: hypothetical protein LBG81_02130 [Coriobacteriaceae bacterium]|jgi:hypothetical protein|nr:hypothetical protein [Coriobacteriaceae bacterium]
MAPQAHDGIDEGKDGRMDKGTLGIAGHGTHGTQAGGEPGSGTGTGRCESAIAGAGTGRCESAGAGTGGGRCESAVAGAGTCASPGSSASAVLGEEQRTAPTNADLTQAWFDEMDALEGDIPGRRAARAYMEASTAIVHHQVVDSSFVPRLYGQATYEAMRNTATTVHGILCKVIQHYLDDPAYRTLFSFDPRLERLILVPRGYDALLPFARVDVFLNEDDLSVAFCEFNADGSSGMNEDREITNSLRGSATSQAFSRRHRLASSDLFDTWVDEFMAIYGTYRFRVSAPHVAICDYLDHGVVDEFEVFRSLFEARGVSCTVADVRDLRFHEGVLSGPDGKAIDAIWRRSVTNDIIEFWDESLGLIEAVLAEKVALIGSFAGHVVHDKQIFQVLRHPWTTTFLTPSEAAFIEATIPRTCFLDDGNIELASVKAAKDRWIIKPTDHYGADKVFAGCFFSQGEWEALVDRYANAASGEPFLVQSYCTPYKTLTLPPDTALAGIPDAEACREGAWYNNLQGLYLYNGRFAGVFSRLGPLPTISKDMKGMTSATLWVDVDDAPGPLPFPGPGPHHASVPPARGGALGASGADTSPDSCRAPDNGRRLDNGRAPAPESQRPESERKADA